MLKIQLPFRDRKLIAISFIVILAWASLHFAIWPLGKRFFELRLESFRMGQSLSKLKSLAGRRGLIEKAQESLSRFWSDDSLEQSQRRFLNDIEVIAQSAGVGVSMKPKQSRTQGKVSELIVEVEVDAQEQALLSFIDLLIKDDSLLDVERLKISSGVSSNFPLRSTILLSRLVIHKN
jgi:hypothetical protein